MKEVVKVSIAGLAFDLDVAAYEELNRYLATLEAGYEGNPDGGEIIADIEARIVELILSEQSAQTVVDEPLIRSVVEQLGMPDDLKADTGNAEKYTPVPKPERFPKRLYRNPEGAKFGGVCSGLGTYFGVDPVWIRVGFFAPLLLCIVFAVVPGLSLATPLMGALFGAFMLLYLILWIAIPLAKTPRQLLEMRGERVTAASIEEIAQEYPREVIYRSASGADSAMSAVGRVLLFCIKAFVLMLGVGFAVAAIGVVIAMFSFPWVDALTDHTFLEPFRWLTGISGPGFVTLVLSAILIPLVMLAYGLICLVFSKKINKVVMWILAIAWLIIVVYTGSSLLTFRMRSPEVIETIHRHIPSVEMTGIL